MSGAAVALIDLKAVVSNYQRVKDLAPNSRVMAIVKSNAYGHGDVEVCGALAHADAFGVARVDEGMRLRAQGITKTIVVLEGFRDLDELKAMVHHQLEPVVHSRFQLDIVNDGFREPVSLPLPVWLKLDTGMNRLGFHGVDFRESYEMAAGMQQLSIRGILSHFACADDPTDEMTRVQLETFDRLTAGLDHDRSLANSAGILAWPATIREWVRPGLMLYGGSPFPDRDGAQFGLREAMTFKSRLIAVRSIPQGGRIGYGATFECPRDMTVGVVAAGYGDGYPREITAAEVLVAGARCAVVGRVSMDMITIDLSGAPRAGVGDEVVLWGPGLSVHEVASCARTISYTLMTGITNRTAYEYQESAVAGNG